MNEKEESEPKNSADESMEDVSSVGQSSPMSTEAATPPVETQENDGMHEWSAFYDSSGRLYYYNSTTGDSSWEEPDKFNPPPLPDDQAAADEGAESVPVDDGKPKEEEGEKGEAAESMDTESNLERAEESVEASGPWTSHLDDEGREYYYNEETGQTQWEKPDNLATLEPSGDGDLEPSSPQQPVSPNEAPTMTEAGEPENTPDEEQAEEEKVEPEEEIDPAVKKLQDAENALNEPDAILEPSCWSNVWAVVESLGQAEGGKKAMQALVASFQGETAICGLLTLWLAELRTASSSNSSAATVQKKVIDSKAAESSREIVQDVLNRIAQERFTKTGGDNILNLDKKSASFLEEMMDSERWRKLLIDLSASNADSALLMYCLEAISKRGHHREISRRVNQSDHFAVFNAMLASEFAVVGKVAVSACSDGDLTMGIDGIVEDLRRTCTSTSYTYLHAIEVLRELISIANNANASEAGTSRRFQRATHKWERLQEELENAMVDPAVASTGSPLFRKRRLDVALTISDLYQRQRRRRKPSIDQANGDKKHSDSLESALLNLLRRNYLGTRMDDRLLDQLLQKETSLGATGEVGKLLVSHPLSVKVLLGHLFKPVATRVSSTQTKQKCARLVALAVIAAENAVREEATQLAYGSLDQLSDTDEISITEMIILGSELCSQVENMVSFTVSADAIEVGEHSSIGRKLSTLAMKSASVAQGVVMWATEIARGPEFVTSASYPTLTPSILSLVRLVGCRHPFTRRSILDMAFIFLKHSNSEISYQKMNEIKEQTLRLLLFLLVKGEVTSVLGEISRRLRQSGNSEMDASLIRYFFDGLLDILRPPYSLPLVRSMGQMLSAPRCVEALKSSYFNQPNKKRLVSVVQNFKETLADRGTGLSRCTDEDSALVTSLVTVYTSS